MNELIGHLGIDWKLLLAQAVNFFVLLYVLKRFAYGPIMKMLKNRQNRIAEGERFRIEAGERLKSSGVDHERIIAEANVEALETKKKSQARAEELQAEMLKESVRKSETIILEARKRSEEEKAKMEEKIFAGAGELIKTGVARVIGRMPSEEKNQVLIKEALALLKSQSNNI